MSKLLELKCCATRTSPLQSQISKIKSTMQRCQCCIRVKLYFIDVCLCHLINLLAFSALLNLKLVKVQEDHVS